MDLKLEIKGKTRDELAEIILSLQENYSKRISEIETSVATHASIISQQKTQIQSQSKFIQELYEQLRLQRYQRFGTRSEKYTSEDLQLNLLFSETQLPENKEEIEKADEEITDNGSTRKKKKAGRKALPSYLPRKEIIHDLSDAEKTCPCGCQLTHIGHESSEQLKIIPAKIEVIKHVHLKYACLECGDTVKQAKHPKQPIPKSIASPGLLAHVLISKYEDHLPLYRQERAFKRIGVDIARATLSLWVIRCANLLAPLYKLLQANIQDYDVAFADETTFQVLKEPGRPAQSKSYMWAFGGGPPETFAYLYEYASGRSHEVPDNFLEGFSGYLHSDGFSAYETLACKREIKLVGCWFHARRKFVEAEKVSPKKGLASEAIAVIKKLSKLEAAAKNKQLTPKQIRVMRQKNSKPIVEAFKTWLDKYAVTAPEESLIGKAISYTRKQWPKLLTYLEDGRLEMSNNRTERAIKPFVIGRKNWMFANSVDGANAAAIVLSIIETCKAHDVLPYDYLTHVLTKLPSCETIEDLEPLLPYHFKKPDPTE